MITAAARWSVWVENLVSDFAGDPEVTKVQFAVENERPSDPGPEDNPENIRVATGGAESVFRKTESSGVIDDDDRTANYPFDGLTKGLQCPIARNVGNDRRTVPCAVEVSGNGNPHLNNCRKTVNPLSSVIRQSVHGPCWRRSVSRNLSRLDKLPVVVID